MISFDAVRDAFNAADDVLRNADKITSRAVEHAAGRLRRLDPGINCLRELKRELEHFDARKGRWKTRT